MNTWSHFCKEAERIIVAMEGQECSWCGAVEKSHNIYKGLFWTYPKQELMRYPEYIEYYYWQDKKSS